MFELVHAKSPIAGHIRNLFRFRPVQLIPSTWVCVIRNGKLALVHRYHIKSEDYEIIRCFLRPGQIPSWFKTNMAIRKHWSLLKPIALERLHGLQP